jgi:formyl-CoA transferase
MAILANQAGGFLNTGKVPPRQGNSHPSLVPYQDFPTRDGAMLLAIGNDGQFARFCDAAGCPELARDARYASNPQRVKHREELVPRLMDVTRTRSTAEWITLLEDKAVPCGPINDNAGAVDEQVVRAVPGRSTGASPQAVAAAGARHPQCGQPVAPAVHAAGACRAAPVLGEHTDECWPS